MADLPLIISCDEDFLIHLFAFPEDGTVADLTAAAASLVVGIHVQKYPAEAIRIRKITDAAPLDGALSLKDAGITFMDWLNICFDTAKAQGATIQ